jgi:transglutaminase superfamily protein
MRESAPASGIRFCLTAVLLGALTSGLIACGRDAGNARLRYDLTLENAAMRTLSRGFAWVYMPAIGTAEFAVEGAPGARKIVDNLGNQQLAFELDDLAETFQLAFSTSITLDHTKPRAVDSSDLAAVRLLAPEQLIETGDASIKAKADELRAPDVERSVANVREFVGKVVRVPPSTEPALSTPASGAPALRHGAAFMLAHGVRDDADRALLGATLLRALGVPARIVGGFLDNGDNALSENEARVWVEYVDGGQWKPLLPADAGARDRAIVFRIFQSAVDLGTGSTVDSLYRSVGLRLKVRS